MHRNSRLLSKLFLLWLPLVVAALFSHVWGQVSASEQSAQDPDAPPLQWSDDFETYTPHDEFVPDADIWNAEWTHSGLQDMFVYTDQASSGVQSLKGHGVYGDCAGSAAYRPIGGYAPIEIDVWIRNDTVADQPLSGCHPVYGALELSTAPAWQGDHRGLMAFDYAGGDYVIYGGDWEVENYGTSQQPLGNFQLGMWYHVRVRYERLDGQTVRLTYWVEDMDTPAGQQELPSRAFEGELAYLGLWVGEGVAWHDNVTVYAAEEPPATAELTLAKAASPSVVAPGSALSYSLVVTNAGPEDATNVVLTDELPDGVTFQSATPAEANCQENAGTVTCNIGTLAAGASTTVNLNVTAPASSGALVNSASVSHATLELNPADNTDTAAVLVSANPSSIFLPIIRKDG